MKKCPHCNISRWRDTDIGKKCEKCGFENSKRDAEIRRYRGEMEIDCS